MEQRIIYQAYDSLKSKRQWFGDSAVNAILDIAETIEPFMSDQHPNVPYFYQTLFVAQRVTDAQTGNESWAYNRILSNLIPGCPVFYAVRIDNLGVPVDGIGFRNDVTSPDETLDDVWESSWALADQPGVNLSPINKPSRNIERQYILARQTLQRDRLERLFGTDILALVESLDNLSNRIETEDGNPVRYFPYVVDQYDERNRRYYSGIVLSNLVLDMPVIYPTFRKEFAANRSGGFRSVVLPNDVLNEIQSIDLTGCSLKPALPVRN